MERIVVGRVGAPVWRMLLIVLQATVAVTAAAGGLALVIGSIAPGLAGVLVPPPRYLEGSPFGSYLVPGLVLAIVLGGIHAIAAAMQLRRRRTSLLWSAAAAFATLIWIFVQMIVIPFSFLQAAYFGAGVAEAGLVMLSLGIADRAQPRAAARS